MHFPSEGYYLTEIGPLLTPLFVLVAFLTGFRILRWTFGDQADDELRELNRRFATGLLTLDQYRQEKTKIRKQTSLTGGATHAR